MATPIPSNTAPFSADEILAATGGELLASLHGQVRGVVTDSRADVRGKLFVALRGAAFDGHEFVEDVLDRGAAGVVVSRAVKPRAKGAVIRVADTLVALGDLARWHRRRWGGKVVAVGGSAGKTTTRAAIGALLEHLEPNAVAYERGNLNNQIGVPMVLLAVQPHHRFAVVEVGTNQIGEVPALAQVCEPNLAVLTLVDLEHTEGLGDLDAIEREEGALLASVREPGVAIANRDDKRAARQLAQCGVRLQLGYGTREGSDYRVIQRDPIGLEAAQIQLARPRGEPLEFRCRLVGEPGALAAAAAVAVAETLLERALDAGPVEAALDRPSVREAGRLVPVELTNGTVVLDDTYNANPASVRSSILTARELASARGARLVLVLGEMRELGPASVEEHRNLAQTVAASEAALLVGIAGEAAELVDAAQRVGVTAQFVADSDAALVAVMSRVEPRDVILVKASRSVRAERVVEGLKGAQGART